MARGGSKKRPWLIPPLRKAIAEKVLSSTDPAAVLGGRPRTYLRPIRPRCRSGFGKWQAVCRKDLSPGQLQLLDQLKSFTDDNHDNYEKAAAAALRRLTGVPRRPSRRSLVGRRSSCRGAVAAPRRRLWTTTTFWPWKRRRVTTRPWKLTRRRKKRRHRQGCFASWTPPCCRRPAGGNERG